MEREDSRDQPNELEKKLAEYARIGLPVLTVAIALTAGFVQGPASAILVLAGGALIGVIAIFWASVRTLLGETPLSGADAYALAAPRSEEEQKRAVLRALKDLEFERSVGKISEEDYVELVARYRGEAKRLLRRLDEEAQPRRERVEALVTKRLRREGLAGPAVPATDKTTEKTDDEAEAATTKPVESDDDDRKSADPAARSGKAKKRKKPREAAAIEAQEAPEASIAPAAEAKTRTCAECGTKNDPDAVFCKKCGARQEAAAAAEAKTATATTSDDGEDAS
ncbi:MAG: zinc-ribbon domain-containing protein [Byssovorax sp.]